MAARKRHSVSDELTTPRRVADAMIVSPTVHDSVATVGELRAFFDDDHKHMALLVDAGRLIGVVERVDLRPEVSDETPAVSIATLAGRTIRPDAAVAEAFAVMTHDARRRLAVTTGSTVLVGLLCLKAAGLGFCSDADVRARSCSAPPPRG